MPPGADWASTDATERRQQLRGAVHRGDAAAIVASLRTIEPSECLQLGGDGLVIALDHDAEGAPERAGQWVGRGTPAGRARAWLADGGYRVVPSAEPETP